MWSGEPREQKSVDGVCDRAGEDLGERSGVTMVRPSQRAQVPRAISLVDHGRRIPVPDQKKVRHEPADSSVSVTERVDPLEASVEIGYEKHHVLVTGRPPLGISQPVGDERRDFSEGRRRHPAGEGADVVLPERAGPFTRMQVVRRRM
jgi:hypothetical protein